MCGIAGFLDLRGATSNELGRHVLGRMADALTHRGPDDSGIWFNPQVGIGLGHRRLSILDLSPGGHQPMVSADQRYVIAFNGEIYNFREIRAELAADATGITTHWRGHSDTEVMLAAFVRWGVNAALERFNGMFAFALWDQTERVLYLARDRMGEKPLYYGWLGRILVFGSEIRSLRVHPDWHGNVNRDALTLLLRHGYIGAPHSIFDKIQKLPPAALLTVWADQTGVGTSELSSYWSLPGSGAREQRDAASLANAESIDALEQLLRDSVRLRMEADVPLGAFLSGGIDSSLVVALMQAQSSRPVRTFSIGFQEQRFDESVHARAVARHLGTDHTELRVTAEEAMAVAPRLGALYDEPFADSSQIPTYLVSKLARKSVTVSLSGDGGDELFCGYDRYANAARHWRHLALVPNFLRTVCGLGLRAGGGCLVGAGQGLRGGRGLAGRVIRGGRKAARVSELLMVDDRQAFYRRFISSWVEPEKLVLGSRNPDSIHTSDRHRYAGETIEDAMMRWDMGSYLPDDILVKVDRASMAVGLEARVPLLDHRLVEFAARLPLAFKVRDGVSKWMLRKVLYRHVPAALLERPKMGFGVPLATWLRGPLRDWGESLLSGARLRQEGFFEPNRVREYWDELQSGSVDHSSRMWPILMFQSWLATTSPG